MTAPAANAQGTTITSILWTGWGKGAQAALQLGVVAILARLVTPADFGVVNAVMIVIGFSAIFSRAGLGPALVQRRELAERHIATAFVASPILGFIVGAVVWAAAPAIAELFRMDGATPMLRVLACVFPIKGFGVIGEALLERDLRFRWLANLEVVSFAVGYGGVGVVGALLGWGAWALVAANLGESVVKTGALLVARRPPRRLVMERDALRELVHFGGGFTIGRYFNYLALQGDNLVVGRWLGPLALGLYGRAYQLMANPAALFGDVLDKVLFPTMARIQDDPPRLRETYRRGVTLIALVMLPVSVVLYVLAPEIIRIALGPMWGDVVAPFRLLAFGMLFRTSYKMSDAIARATGNVYRRALRQVVYAALVTGGAVVGQRWGVSGVALAVSIALGVNFVVMAQLSLRVTGLTWAQFAGAHRAPVMLAAAALAGLAPVAAVLRTIAAPGFVVALIAAATALMSATLAIRALPNVFLGDDGIWMLGRLRARLPLARWTRATSTVEHARAIG